MISPPRPLAQAEQRLRSLVTEVLRLHVAQFRASSGWTPAINVYRYPNRLVVCVDLADVKPQELSVEAQPLRLRLRDHRTPPGPAIAQPPLQVLAMEIDAGPFERDLRLPVAIDPDRPPPNSATVGSGSTSPSPPPHEGPSRPRFLPPSPGPRPNPPRS